MQYHRSKFVSTVSTKKHPVVDKKYHAEKLIYHNRIICIVLLEIIKQIILSCIIDRASQLLSSLFFNSLFIDLLKKKTL